METESTAKSERHATLRSAKHEHFRRQPSPEQPVSPLPIAAAPPSTPPPPSPHRLLTATRCGEDAQNLEMDVDRGELDHGDGLTGELGEEEGPDSNGSEGLVERSDDLDGIGIPSDDNRASFWYEANESTEGSKNSLVVSAKARAEPR